MLSADPISYFQHQVGSGRHYINCNFRVFENGNFQLGDSSDICIILNAQRLCTAFALPPIWQVWSQAYPDDPMTCEDAGVILNQAQRFTEDCDPTIPDDRADILADLRAIGCDRLAGQISGLLKSKGLLL